MSRGRLGQDVYSGKRAACSLASANAKHAIIWLHLPELAAVPLLLVVRTRRSSEITGAVRYRQGLANDFEVGTASGRFQRGRGRP